MHQPITVIAGSVKKATQKVGKKQKKDPRNMTSQDRYNLIMGFDSWDNWLYKPANIPSNGTLIKNPDASNPNKKTGNKSEKKSNPGPSCEELVKQMMLEMQKNNVTINWQTNFLPELRLPLGFLGLYLWLRPYYKTVTSVANVVEKKRGGNPISLSGVQGSRFNGLSFGTVIGMLNGRNFGCSLGWGNATLSYNYANSGTTLSLKLKLTIVPWEMNSLNGAIETQPIDYFKMGVNFGFSATWITLGAMAFALSGYAPVLVAQVGAYATQLAKIAIPAISAISGLA